MGCSNIIIRIYILNIIRSTNTRIYVSAQCYLASFCGPLHNALSQYLYIIKLLCHLYTAQHCNANKILLYCYRIVFAVRMNCTAAASTLYNYTITVNGKLLARGGQPAANGGCNLLEFDWSATTADQQSHKYLTFR